MIKFYFFEEDYYDKVEFSCMYKYYDLAGVTSACQGECWALNVNPMFYIVHF